MYIFRVQGHRRKDSTAENPELLDILFSCSKSASNMTCWVTAIGTFPCDIWTVLGPVLLLIWSHVFRPRYDIRCGLCVKNGQELRCTSKDCKTDDEGCPMPTNLRSYQWTKNKLAFSISLSQTRFPLTTRRQLVDSEDSDNEYLTLDPSFCRLQRNPDVTGTVIISRRLHRSEARMINCASRVRPLQSFQPCMYFLGQFCRTCSIIF